MRLLISLLKLRRCACRLSQLFRIRRIHFTKEGVRVCVLYTADSWLQCWQYQPGIMCYDDVELLSKEREEKRLKTELFR